MKKAIRMALIALISFCMISVGLAFGQAETSSTSGHIYHMEQKVQGNGFFSTYQDADVKNLSLDNTAHGSGSYDIESNLDMRDGVKYNEAIDSYTATADRGTTLIESVDFTYAPMTMQMGKFSHPIAFRSKGAELTCLKNFVSGVSMNAKFSQVDTLSKNLSSELYWKFSSSTDESQSSYESKDRTRLNFEAAFSGQGHVGVLDNGRDPHAGDILIDEDYSGTYYITKNMSFNNSYTRKQEVDEWLPCCSGGFGDMNAMDRKPFKSGAGIFDCTCFKTPTEAQFQRVY